MINTSGEDVIIQAVALITTISSYEEGLEPEWEKTIRVRSTGLCSKQLKDKVRQQNEKEKLTHLNRMVREGLEPVIMECQDLFKKPTDGKIPFTTFGEHKIKTGDAEPIKKLQYSCPYTLRDEMRKQLDEMKERGVITEAISNWAASVILVTKKSVDQRPRYRFCADFRELNAVTEIPVHPVPIVQEHIDRLNGSKYFTLEEMEDACYHIPIKKQDRHKTEIISPFGIYQYERLAVGLAGVSSIFTRVINNVLLGLGERSDPTNYPSLNSKA